MRTLVLVLVMGSVVGGCATVGGRAAPASTQHIRAQLLPSDSVLLRTARIVARTAPRMDEVWPGFWSPDAAFILYAPEEAVLLVSPVEPPAGFHPLPDPAVPPELRGRTYLYRGALPGLEGAFHVDYPAGSASATAVAVRQHDVRSALTTLFHEAFHGYQNRRFAPAPSGSDGFVDPAHLAAPEFRALAEVERRMLTEALELPAAGLPELLRQYLAVRLLRARSSPQEVQAVERQLERIEGSATLVGLQAALLAFGEGGEPLPEALRAYLTRSLDGLPGGLPERLIRWRVYGTGAAIGYALDRLGNDWRPALEEGATFDDLLGVAVRFDPAAAPALAADALERFGFRELVAEGMTRAEGTEIRSAEDFHALAPFRLLVEFIVPIEDGRPSMSINFSAATGGFSQLEPSLVAIPDPEVFTLQLPGGSLVVRGHPVLQDLREIGRERLRITVLLPHAPTIDGEVPLPEGEHHLQRLQLAADGMQLSLEAPATLQVSANQWLIRADAAERQQPQ